MDTILGTTVDRICVCLHSGFAPLFLSLECEPFVSTAQGSRRNHPRDFVVLTGSNRRKMVTMLEAQSLIRRHHNGDREKQGCKIVFGTRQSSHEEVLIKGQFSNATQKYTSQVFLLLLFSLK